MCVSSDNDWHNNPNDGCRAKWRPYGYALLKFLVLLLLAVAVGQLGLILFQTVRLSFFS